MKVTQRIAEHQRNTKLSATSALSPGSTSQGPSPSFLPGFCLVARAIASLTTLFLPQIPRKTYRLKQTNNQKKKNKQNHPKNTSLSQKPNPTSLCLRRTSFYFRSGSPAFLTIFPTSNQSKPYLRQTKNSFKTFPTKTGHFL